MRTCQLAVLAACATTFVTCSIGYGFLLARARFEGSIVMALAMGMCMYGVLYLADSLYMQRSGISTPAAYAADYPDGIENAK